MGAGNTTIRAMAAGFRTISVAIKDRRPHGTKGRGVPWPQHQAPGRRWSWGRPAGGNPGRSWACLVLPRSGDAASGLAYWGRDERGHRRL